MLTTSGDNRTPKCLGHAASDFEEFTNDELTGVNLLPGCKAFGVPALYRHSHSYRDGLRPGDIILSLDGHSFDSVKSLNSYIRTRPELDITLDFLRAGKIHRMQTKLHAEQDFPEACKTIEELRVAADFGDPYALLQARGSLKETHWDFLGLSTLSAAQKMAEGAHRPVLIGLFGSSMCCVHLAPWTAPYRDIIADDSLQRIITGNYVSTLVIKPEAYSLYRQYGIDSRFPAMLQMTGKSELKSFFTIKPDTDVSSMLHFLQEK